MPALTFGLLLYLFDCPILYEMPMDYLGKIFVVIYFKHNEFVPPILAFNTDKHPIVRV